MDKLKKLFQPKYVLVILSVIFCIVLCYGFKIGMADNGDFKRIFGVIGISDDNIKEEEKYFNYVHEQYNVEYNLKDMLSGYINTSKNVHYLSTQTIFIEAAMVINLIFSRTTFYLIILATVYIVFFAIAMYYIYDNIRFKNKVIQWIVSILIFFVTCNISSIAYFNSFYSEAVTYISLLFMIGFFFKCLNLKSFQNKYFVLFSIATIIFLGAKQQNTILIFPILLFYIILVIKFLNKMKYRVIAAISAVFMVGVSYVCFTSISSYISGCTVFNSVFCGIANVTDDMEGALKELDIDPRMSVIATDFWTIDKDKEKIEYIESITQKDWQKYKWEDIVDKLSKGKVIKYYLGHMDELFKGYNYTLTQVFGDNVLMKSSVVDNMTNLKNVMWWENTERFVFSKILPIQFTIITFYVIVFIYICYNFIKSIKLKDNYKFMYATFLLLLFVIAWLQFAIQFVANGIADTAKQIYLFNIITDFYICLFVVVITKYFAEKYKRTEFVNKIKNKRNKTLIEKM